MATDLDDIQLRCRANHCRHRNHLVVAWLLAVPFVDVTIRDVFAFRARTCSLDAEVREETPLDFVRLQKSALALRHACLNGRLTSRRIREIRAPD